MRQRRYELRHGFSRAPRVEFHRKRSGSNMVSPKYKTGGKAKARRRLL